MSKDYLPSGLSPFQVALRMAKENDITEENFVVLLAWLDHDRESAAHKYEKIRQRLIRILHGRGCFEAEELADETFNRVTGKVHQLSAVYVGEPALYFYGVADKIYLEWLRRQKKTKQLQIPENERKNASEIEIEHECLESCLEKLPADQRELIVEYYREEKSAKIKNRQKLAAKHGVSANALQVKALRIRTRLKDCVRACIAGKSHF
jgi:RNA polymerase sigma factor (sigma-70 family)